MGQIATARTPKINRTMPFTRNNTFILAWHHKRFRSRGKDHPHKQAIIGSNGAGKTTLG
jgi:hypothetical protein